MQGKYTPQHRHITLTVQAQPDFMQIRMSNTSSKVSDEERSRLFDTFYRTPHADLWKQGGTGLGLALVQTLMAQLGSTIAVENAAEKLYFTLALPLSNADS
ncbi:MAG: sensor histidine kinase [Stenomitos frigidus ULC029]